MKSYGNGHPATCVNNLLGITRGEVPYERIKGISTTQINKGSPDATDEMVADAEWLLDTYEPRAIANGIELVSTDAENGAYELRADITVKEDTHGGT